MKPTTVTSENKKKNKNESTLKCGGNAAAVHRIIYDCVPDEMNRELIEFFVRERKRERMRKNYQIVNEEK